MGHTHTLTCSRLTCHQTSHNGALIIIQSTFLTVNVPHAQQVTYVHELARYYMWAQTDHTVFIACHVPTGERPLVDNLLIHFPLQN